MRLISQILNDYQIHVLNWGMLPSEDALFARIRPHLTLHQLTGPNDNENGIRELIERIRPDVIINGEGPIAGKLRLTSLIGNSLGIRQIAIENYYGPSLIAEFQVYLPYISKWLLLGLLEEARPHQTFGKVEVVPPLITHDLGPHAGKQDRICILGYDEKTLHSGLQLLERLPRSEKADIFTSAQLIDRVRGVWTPPAQKVEIYILPTDAVLYQGMSQAKFIIGKAGFQQVVEGISLGAPVICQKSGGGIEPFLVPPYLRPYVRFLNNDKDINRIMLDVTVWTTAPPDLPWKTIWTGIKNPLAFAANKLVYLIESFK